MVLGAALEFANAGHYSETTLELSRKLSAIKTSPSTSTGLKSPVHLAANPPHIEVHKAESESSIIIIIFHIAIYRFAHIHSKTKLKHRAQIEIAYFLDCHESGALKSTQIVHIFDLVYGNPEYYDLRDQLAGWAARWFDELASVSDLRSLLCSRGDLAFDIADSMHRELEESSCTTRHVHEILKP